MNKKILCILGTIAERILILGLFESLPSAEVTCKIRQIAVDNFIMISYLPALQMGCIIIIYNTVSRAKFVFKRIFKNGKLVVASLSI